MPTKPSRAAAVVAVPAYVLFLLVVLWAEAFLANLPGPGGVDRGPRTSTGVAVAVDLALLGAFAVHHSVFARAGVKRRLAQVLPAAYERSAFVLVSSLLLALVLWAWRPLTAVVWEVTWTPGRVALWALYGLGWAVAVSATFMIDHFEFAGLRQAGLLTRLRTPGPGLHERWLYAWVRHPMMLGLLVAFFATPTMTAGHLLFALAGAAYIAVGLRFEERALARDLGPTYADYVGRVPALVPVRRPRVP